jgi:hypothetical protein
VCLDFCDRLVDLVANYDEIEHRLRCSGDHKSSTFVAILTLLWRENLKGVARVVLTVDLG